MRLTVFVALFLAAASSFALYSLRGDSEAAWPGEEGKIAFHNTGVDPGIYTVDFDGGNLTQLTTGADFYPHWSPDGESIVFQRGAEGLSSGNATPQGGGPQVWTMDADGGNQQFVVNGYEPSWTADGSRILLVQDAEILEIGPDGSDIEVLTDSADDLFYPVMSPDGAKIAFTRQVQVLSPGQAAPNSLFFEYELWVMDSDGGNAALVADVEAGVPFSSDWAPDSSNLVFSAGNMYTVVPGQQPVSQGLDEYTPETAYSPDGDPIVFSGYHPEGCGVDEIVYTIVYVPVGGSEQDITEIVGDPGECEDEYHFPDWQPVTVQPIVQDVIWADANCSEVVDPVDSLLTLRADAGLAANTGDCPPLKKDITVVQVLPAGISEPHDDVWGNVNCTENGLNPVDSLAILRFDAHLPVEQTEPCPPMGAGVTIQYFP